MIDLAVKGYTRERVRDALHGRHGSREVFYRYDLLGTGNVKKGELRVVSGEIAMDTERDIKRTGRFVVKDEGNINWQADKIQPWFCLRMPDGGTAEWPLGVFYMPTCPRSGHPGAYYREVEGYDVTINLQQDAVTSRYYVGAGTPYVNAVSSLLAGMGVYNAMITPSGATLTVSREWEAGTPRMEIIDDLLSAVAYDSITADAWGRLVAKPYRQLHERPVDYDYRKGSDSVLLAGGDVVTDAFYLPNVFIGTLSSPETVPMTYLYEITNPDNALAASNRDGRRIVKKLLYDDIASMAELRMVVEREASQASQIYETVTFRTANMPHHEAGDILYIDGDTAEGRYYETGWTLRCEAGAEMEHNVRRVVAL